VKRLEDYRGIVSDEVIADLHRRALDLQGKRVVHVNSTAQGGGVAEILQALVPLMNDVGLEAGWRVLVGSDDFFGVTKKFHNGLQGEAVRLSDDEKRIYTRTNEDFAQYTHISRHDAIIVHDPQPLPLISFYEKRQPWIWRCHIDLTEPDPGLWGFLKGYITRYDRMIVSHPQYRRPDVSVEQRVINPAIDPLSRKNIALSERAVVQHLERHHVPLDRPLITQVSRFDKWKDPEGVVGVFERVRERADCRLVLAGNMATDDPEGTAIYERVLERAGALVDSGDIVLLLGADDAVINALQRASTVVLQKSLREGFGLTVSEAMWKGTPVVAGAVGGIPLQVIDGETGFLVEPTDLDQTADRVTAILSDRALASEMAARGVEHVREHFLMTRLLGDYLTLLAETMELR
jgi:trehalose synthase